MTPIYEVISKDQTFSNLKVLLHMYYKFLKKKYVDSISIDMVKNRFTEHFCSKANRYSYLPNERAGPNKRAAWTNSEPLITVQAGITPNDQT